MAEYGGYYKINGIPQTGEELTTGNVYFVHSVTGSDGNSGRDPKHPFATLDKATNSCTANKHDVVYIMPNHAETIASATSWVPDVAGVQYIGIGVGSDAPELTFSATASKINVTADNQTFKNIRFVAGISAIVEGVQVSTGDHCTFDGCTWDFSTTAYDFLVMLDIDDAHYTTVKNCRFIAENATAGSNMAIRLDASNYVKILNNSFSGDYAVAMINSASTDGASKSVEVLGNQMYNDDTASTAGGIRFAVANTGIIADNRIAWLNDDEGDKIIDPGSCLLMENYTCTAIDTYGVATLIGTASS